MYQQSCDLGLGVPFNITSYALLTCMLAHVCGLSPGDLVHVLGDAHVYTTHEEALRRQLRNQPRPFPRLSLNPAKRDLDSFKDVSLDGYDPHAPIRMPMAL